MDNMTGGNIEEQRNIMYTHTHPHTLYTFIGGEKLFHTFMI